jgi:hypothetical protein
MRGILAILIFVATSVQATTYYVDQAPKTLPRNGLSLASAFLTIQSCFDAVRPGDTCEVSYGIYRESPYLSSRLGTASAPIIIRGLNFPKIDCSGFSTNCVNLNSDATKTQLLSYVTFEGFEITKGKYTGLKYGFADHLTIRNNYIHHNGERPGEGNGILGGGYAITIDRNRIAQNGILDGIYNQTHGMYLLGTGYTITNNIIDGNGAYGIQSRAKTCDLNAHPDCRYAGFSDVLIANNTFAYSMSRPGLILWADYATADWQKNIKILNNIFFQNGQGGTGIEFSGPSASVVASNNLWFGTYPGAQLFANTGACSMCDLDGNYVGNPLMTNAPLTRPTAPDFHLQSTSPARNAGTPVPIGFDVSGVARPQEGAFDIGAYEFISGASTASKPAPPVNLQAK